MKIVSSDGHMDKDLLARRVLGPRATGPIAQPSDEDLDQVLDTLHPRERLVIEHRFCPSPMTLDALGVICPRYLPKGAVGLTGISKERVRQVEAKALVRLRHWTRRRVLWPTLAPKVRRVDAKAN